MYDPILYMRIFILKESSMFKTRKKKKILKQQHKRKKKENEKQLQPKAALFKVYKIETEII